MKLVIPDMEAVADELQQALLYEDGNEGVVKRVAEIMDLKKRTVYDYLYGRTKLSLDFIKAAVVATNGHPRIKRLLEPEGWVLVPECKCAPMKDVEKELGDVYVSAASLHREVREALKDGVVSRREKANLVKGIDAVIREVSEIRSVVEGR